MRAARIWPPGKAEALPVATRTPTRPHPQRLTHILEAQRQHALGSRPSLPARHSSLAPDSSWWSCLQCSWQSLTTVGYGTIATTGYAASLIGAVAVILSMIFDAVRDSRPPLVIRG